MSDEAALLAAIRANPEEDTPRLMYADWLDEQGGASNEAHAEFIRLQIELAQAEPSRRQPPGQQEKETRARTLFWKHDRVWFPDLFGRKKFFRGVRAGWYDMRRGFLDKLQCDASVILRVGERFTQLAPITEFQMQGVTTDQLEEFMRAPWARGARTVGISGGWGNLEPNYESLAEGQNFVELRDLAILSGWLDAASARRIALAKVFPKLERFSFDPYSDNDAPAALFSGKTFTGLKALELAGGGTQISGHPMPG